MSQWIAMAQQVLAQVRASQPLIHLITNAVTRGEVANAVLALGARPVMAHAAEEITDITPRARALVLNLGTPSRERVEVMVLAAQQARAHGVPVLFDPVGVGISTFRRASAARVLATGALTVVRGNADEIGVLAGMVDTMTGVDAQHADYERAVVVPALARAYRAVVVCTGATDWVSDGARGLVVENGHPALRRFAGAGDMLDGVIAAAMAVTSDPLIAAMCGLVWLGIAAEEAARAVQVSPGGALMGLGSFRVKLLDALDRLTVEQIQQNARVRFF